VRLRAIALATIAAAAAAAACGGPHRASRIPEGSGPLVATYRAELVREGEPARRAKLLVWAQAPDRLHAELLPPVGGSPVTLDAGGGRAVLVDVEAGAAYVGDAGPEALAPLTGVSIGVADAVAALLNGTAPEGARVDREGEAPGVLPLRFALTLGGSRIGLTRLRWERTTRDPSTLGTGEPPAGLTVRPLAEWER